MSQIRWQVPPRSAKRPPRPVAVDELDPAQHSVEQAIDCFARTRAAYGYRLIWAKCRQAGYLVNRKKVQIALLYFCTSSH